MRALLASDEPSIRWKVRVGVLREDPTSLAIRRLQGVIRRSARVTALLEGHDAARASTYAKWGGAHWVLASLADLGYPAGDDRLVALRDEVLETWLHPRYFRSRRRHDIARTVCPDRGPCPPLCLSAGVGAALRHAAGSRRRPRREPRGAAPALAVA